ncbi:PspC domain-containing protein [Salmonirosea aquatica]|uniref:PspC domain-containing protein n=1 Tax=Salmonirosea aquatica TaxID=2654236 RepID=A0A7C9BQP3_9BACT|nr:PspC domain-containing protein [Cytophagaceae bacterium SJW1-29]
MNTNNRLFRNMNQRVIGGVAAGLADYFDVDVVLMRVLFVLAIFIPVPTHMVLLYIILWIVMPKQPAPIRQLPAGPNPQS